MHEEAIRSRVCGRLISVLAAATTSGLAVEVYAQAARPETGALLGLQHQTDFVFVHGMDERGSPGTGRSSWLRGFGASDSSTSNNSLYQVDGKVWGLQGGFDLPGTRRLDHWRLGVMADAASVGANGSAFGSPATSRGKGDGFGLGLYGTWLQDPARKQGWYADFWGHYALFDNHVDTPGLARGDYRSHNSTASAELGYAFPLAGATGWTMAPQAQWIYIHNHSYNFVESDGTVVEGAHRGGWSSRIGVRMQPGTGDSATAEGTASWRPYAAFNWWHDATGDELIYNQSLSVRKLYPKDRLELAGGARVAIGSRWTTWFGAGWQTGSQSFSAWTGQLGARYAW